MKIFNVKTTYHKHKKLLENGGFTIVELLIVVVVIGILATIITITYNGVTTQALNANRIQGANEARKSLINYQTLNNMYPRVPGAPNDPVVGGSGTACIAGWDASNNCHFYGGNVPRWGNFETDYIKVNPLPKFPSQSTSGDNGLVLIYNAMNTVDGAPMPYSMSYKLQGTNLSCSISGVITGLVVGNPNLFTTNISGNGRNNNSGPDDNNANTICNVALPA